MKPETFKSFLDSVDWRQRKATQTLVIVIVVAVIAILAWTGINLMLR